VVAPQPDPPGPAKCMEHLVLQTPPSRNASLWGCLPPCLPACRPACLTACGVPLVYPWWCCRVRGVPLPAVQHHRQRAVD